MTDITVSNCNLPSTLEDLSKYVLVGREQLVAVRAAIRAIDKVGVAQEVRKQKLKEGQEIGEAVLDAEVRIGELMRDVPKAKNQYESALPTDGQSKTKTEVFSDMGFTHSQVQRFETLAAHPEIVAQAKAEAKENDDIVTRSLVLNMVKQKQKAEERKAYVAEQLAKPQADRHIDIFTTDKKYRVIYADPPWSYNDQQDTEKLGGAVKHYPTMSISEICNLPVPSADDAVLFLWVTSPLLEDSFKVIRAWGFKYKTSFVWDKVLHNMGHYNSVRHEFLLVATKGSCTPDVRKLFDSVVSIERTDHSAKPEEFRQIIDTIYPLGNRIELFARTSADNWDVWGNMV